MILLSYSYPLGAQTKVGSIALDATVNENHTASAQITEHPVESGANITDHIRPLPRSLSLEMVITNTPIGSPPAPNRGVTGQDRGITLTLPPPARGIAVIGSPLTLRPSPPTPRAVKVSLVQFDAPIDRVRDVFGDLVSAALNGALFTITTAIVQYESFAISSFSVPRDVTTGHSSLRGTIEFREIRKATAVVVKGLPAKPKALKKPDHKGEKAPKEATVKEGSTAVKIWDSLKGVFGGK